MVLLEVAVWSCSSPGATAAPVVSPPASDGRVLVRVVVTNTRDSGPGSLRSAIQTGAGDAGVARTRVEFHIPRTDPGFDGTTWTIRPAAQLPALGDRVVVEGSSQTTFAGNTNRKGPEVVLNGSAMPAAEAPASGFVLLGTGSAVRHLVVNGFGVNGILITGGAAVRNTVAGCFIGTDRTGTEAVGNANSGVEISGGAKANTIGGTVVGAGNVISGNAGPGVAIFGTGTSRNVLAGNIVGLDAGRTAVLANAGNGVEVTGGASANMVGGTDAAAGNVVSGNTGFGVAVSGFGTSANLVRGDTVGRTPAGAAAPNRSGGVVLFGGARANQIGGEAPGAGNLIASNSGTGIAVLADARRNRLSGNSLSANSGLGIDLVGGTQDSFGVTADDAGDRDAGANRLQNKPVLTAATGGATITVNGSLRSTPSGTFRIEVFSSASPDPSTYGEGATFIGTVVVTTDAAGMATITFTSTAPVPAGRVVTATATDAFGNTSELSQRVVVTS